MKSTVSEPGLTEEIGVVGNRHTWSTAASSLDSSYHTLVLEKGESERPVTEDHRGREMSENEAASGVPVAHAFKTLPVEKRELKIE